MYKNFTLAIIIAVMPLSQKVFEKDLFASFSNTHLNTFLFKNSFPPLLETQKKVSGYCSQNWMGEARENIRKSEYNFKWEEKLNAYCTPNRINNLRFFYNDKGFTVEPRTTQISINAFDPMATPDNIKYKTLPNWKVKFNLDKRQISKGVWRIADNKAEYITDKITVQYLNNDEGMRQNFIVLKPLSNNGELKINFSIKTKLKAYLNNNQLQFFHKKTNVLNYQELKVWDANGTALQAVIKKKKRKNFSIEVNTKDAFYPITIDPISTTPAAILESNQANANMGMSVASAGDVNGDGYSDVIVGAYTYDNGESDEGTAFVYHGSATGISITASTMVESNQANAYMGWSVALAGDVNGDGYSDVIVGAYTYDNGQSDEGTAFVYHGSATGISSTASTMVESNQANAYMGWSVALAGDVNGDGYSDVIVGALQYNNGQTDEGSAFVYHGSATGINITTPTMVESNQANAYMGRSVASAGDVNGDGYSDVIVGAYNYDNGQVDEGTAFVYHGSAAGISITASAMVESNQANAYMGVSVASTGDVNGDGYSDVIVGAHQYSNGQTEEGAAYVYYGSDKGIDLIAAAMVESNQANAQLGISVASAGDINGDGYSDVLVSAYAYDNGQTDEGAAFLYQGSSTGINTTPAATIEINQPNAYMGWSVAPAGDVNGDGYSDVIIGAYGYDNGQSDEGAAFVYHGSAAGLSTIPNNTPDDADQVGANFGRSVSSAGDLNGDGYSDVIIGAPSFDDGANADEGRAFVYHGSATGLSATPNSTPDDADQGSAFFGYSVATAGDVNGDGFSDVIIGAITYDDGVNVNEGRAFVYHGSATGLSATPNNTPDDADQANAFFGFSVAPAGDVNGDGYSDVIIGANNYDDGVNVNEGRAFVYHGSATGLSAAPNNTPDDAQQANANFGISVSSAGDVNGDGYSDVIIGAHQYDDGANVNEGRAFLYYGSATGLSSTPDTTPDYANQADAQFGFSASCAGDVNGDGYSDIIIGAPFYDDGANTDEGRAFVYYGSATGLQTIPDNIPDDADQANAIFGFKATTAGDVNGDGYSDVIVGAQYYDDGANINEGRAFIYHGSSTGLSASPISTPDDADQIGAWFGSGLASAGDVNNDGYSDVIIGAINYIDIGNSNEGRAFLYNGNDSTGNKRNNLRLYNTDLSTPINSSNFILGNFGTGLYAKSFLGRTKGKLVWETRLNYNAYSGIPITNSTFYTAQQSSYTDLELTGVELKDHITKLLGGRYTKLRARIKYDPVTAITGQVYSPWRNVSSIIDANNPGILPIELISFKAAWLQTGKSAQLNFTTAGESGTCCFDIEKSLDGFHFYSIGTLPAKNISGIQSYSFVDNNALNKKQFYRLKIKGIAGQVDYSNIQQLSAGSGGQNNGNTEILVFPNPTTDILQLLLNKNYDRMNVQIVNSGGQVVKQLSDISVTTQALTISVRFLPAGNYWLRLQNGNDKQVLQFVKQ